MISKKNELYIIAIVLCNRAMVDDEDVIEEHSSVGELKATNEECTSVSLEECFQVSKEKQLNS